MHSSGDTLEPLGGQAVDLGLGLVHVDLGGDHGRVEELGEQLAVVVGRCSTNS